jgi:hypothetical protein
MAESFDPAARLALVRVRFVGPREGYVFRLAIDTRATQTCIRPVFLRQLGFDLSRPAGRTRFYSATGTAPAPVFRVPAVVALSQTRTGLLVAAHDLPLGSAADGLLGLDFFRGLVLKLDFARGLASLFARRWWQFWR